MEYSYNVYKFEFRSSTDKYFEDIQECNDMNGFFIPPAMSNYHASDPLIRRAIAEYEDDSKGEYANFEEERITGHYTQAEYDDINRFSTDHNY